MELNVGKPQVVYRETIRLTRECEGLFDRELGGTPHFAQVHLKLEPIRRGSGFLFQNGLSQAEFPEPLLAAIRTAVLENAASGVVLGYPVVDVRVTLTEARIKEGVSTEADFRVAVGRQAMHDGPPESRADIAGNPMMNVEAIVPDEFTGEVIGDLNARQGKVENIISRKAVKVITASVPPVGHVRILHRPSVRHTGPWHLFHAFFSF